jgi:hypothetical protein
VTIDETRSIQERLDRLERQNRRLKQSALAALVLATALATIYATQRVPQQITAHEFDIVDSNGQVRVRMNTGLGLTLYDKEGHSRAALALTPDGWPAIMLMDTEGWPRAEMTYISGSPSISLTRAKGQGPGSVFMELTPSGAPRIALNDPQGFAMDLGSTNMVAPATGATQQTSAASIVMFGNDKEHRVIWKAP